MLCTSVRISNRSQITNQTCTLGILVTQEQVQRAQCQYITDPCRSYPLSTRKVPLLDKGSTLTFLVPDMVASMDHSMDHLTLGPGFNVCTLST